MYANGAGLTDALSNWDASRRARVAGPGWGSPRSSRNRCGQEVLVHHRRDAGRPDRKHITLPRLGDDQDARVHPQTGRRLEAGTARILKATVRFERGRWLVSFDCLVARDTGRPAHVKPGAAVVGIDAGVKDLLVVADPAGNELATPSGAARAQQAQRTLRALQRKAARQVGPWDQTTRREQDPSQGWQRTRARSACACPGGQPAHDRLHSSRPG